MNRYRIDGPIHMDAVATEQGADLDVSAHLERVVFAELFAAAAEDPQGFAEQFAEMHELSVTAQQQGPDSDARHEYDARVEQMLAEFADGGRIPLYATGMRQLRDALTDILKPRTLPSQRSAGAA